MSRPAVSDSISRLLRTRVITAWRMELDATALGLPITAYIRVRPIARQLGAISNLTQQIREVVECHRITGEDCFLMKVHVASIADLERLIDRFQPYGQTITSIVQSSPVPPRSPPF